MEDSLDEIQRVILLLVASAVVAVFAQKIRIPYTIALLLLGLALSPFAFTPFLRLSSDVILLVFLPPLLFEASFALDLELLWHRRRGVLVLAFAGVGLATVVSGAITYWSTDFPWMIAILFGAMIAATDPVAVLAVFRQLGVDDQLAVLLEGESLFNDGIALVLFVTIIRTLDHGFSIGPATASFAWSFVGSAAVGLIVGGAGYFLIGHSREPFVETIVSVAVAYGAFLLADQISSSGVLATLVAGMALGHAARTRSGLLAEGVEPVIDLWAFLAFVANAMLFLEMGLTVREVGITDHWRNVIWGIVAALVGRAVVSYILGYVIDKVGGSVTIRERHVLFWGGLRGAVALAAALSLAPDIPHQPELLAMTYGVVVFTLLVQGLSITPLVGWLRLRHEDDETSPAVDTTDPRQLNAG
jgi:CPA1 family monovalent cation:H+ antiporter